ncbi:MAG: hypothetical protein HKP30_18155 [Myxococcales bacterium]|nr:hypothetical protein [Myxococcales bacterium]
MGILLVIGIGLILVGGWIRRKNLASERSAAALAIRGRAGVEPEGDAKEPVDPQQPSRHD